MSLADERAGLGHNPDQRLPSCCIRSPRRLGTTHESRRPGRLPSACSRDFIEPTTFRLRDGCSASTWTAPDGSSLLTLPGSSVQTAPDGSRRIVWMIKWMIKAHPTKNRMPRRLTPPQARSAVTTRASPRCLGTRPAFGSHHRRILRTSLDISPTMYVSPLSCPDGAGSLHHLVMPSVKGTVAFARSTGGVRSLV
jgi:hypothetical protein